MRAKGLCIDPRMSNHWLLHLLKPMYGLVDAPLLWQIHLQSFLRLDLKGYVSAYDENLIYWLDHNGRLVMLLTLQVDDLLVAGLRAWLRWLHDALTNKFGALKSNGLPFLHCGIMHTRLPDGGLRLEQ